jgi:hypothetical protein
LVDTVFEESVSDESFIETCNFLRSHAIRLDQQSMEKAARKIQNSSQLSNRAKKDKVKKDLALINEIQFKIHAVQMNNQPQYHRIKLQWYVNWHKYHLRSG